MANLVQVATTAQAVTITLDSPRNRNALSRALVGEAMAAFEDIARQVAERPDDIRAVVLTHTAPAFCAGADLKERSHGAPDSMPFVALLQQIMDLPVPVIAAVKGPVRAGGIGLMAACDLVVVRHDVEFALTEVRLGLAAAVISVPILRRVAPSQLAAAFLTGAPFDADLAHRVGLVSHIGLDDDGVDEIASSLSGAVAMGSPNAVAATKRILRDVPGLDRDVAFEQMGGLSNELFASDDGEEGMASFGDKRPPRWQR
ncbi:MAG: enoyl-CoA hydratase-related protein [Actinomycetota bacterium]|nr:enoyl-CoA hydratase-related protein [Actinomycetota bacterium]